MQVALSRSRSRSAARPRITGSSTRYCPKPASPVKGQAFGACQHPFRFPVQQNAALLRRPNDTATAPGSARSLHGDVERFRELEICMGAVHPFQEPVDAAAALQDHRRQHQLLAEACKAK